MILFWLGIVMLLCVLVLIFWGIKDNWNQHHVWAIIPVSCLATLGIMLIVFSIGGRV